VRSSNGRGVLALVLSRAPCGTAAVPCCSGDTDAHVSGGLASIPVWGSECCCGIDSEHIAPPTPARRGNAGPDVAFMIFVCYKGEHEGGEELVLTTAGQ
jgi:hypothetical protein